MIVFFPFIILIFLSANSTDQTSDTNDIECSTLRTIFIAVDSTAQRGKSDAIGWGKPFAKLFDPNKIKVVNTAIGARGCRIYITEGH
ncbi:MAG: hypothetical protein JW715_14845 [Sedimentisphaerales bacterium]|nr:hypothetical protein [Sedimentisphaerales bacterium]